MKITYAAGFSLSVFLVTGLYTLIVLRSGLRISSVLLPRQAWITENSMLWSLGAWLWMLAIFAWMVLLVTLMWSYSPAHRVATMLQSGLVLIAAVLTIAGVIVWMNVLPLVAASPADGNLMPLVDAFALGFLGAGLFMGGAVTLWIAVDLGRLGVLPRAWLIPGAAAGAFLLPSPFVLPNAVPLILALLFWLVWCGLLASRRKFPNAYTEWA